MQKKKTLVVGASDKLNRYSRMAVESLVRNGQPVEAIGLRKSQIGDVQIEIDRNRKYEDIDTISLYVGPGHQDYWKDFIFEVAPERVIFNPGTSNPEFEESLEKKGIEVLHACTLVMLSSGTY